MRGSDFDEIGFFQALSKSGARVLLIGRRALVLLGLPVLTADYDLWVHPEDVDKLNGATEPFGLFPNRAPDEARRLGRYVLENDEHVDVMASPNRQTVDGEPVAFDELWSDRVAVTIDTVEVAIPSIDGLILTKRLSSEPKHVEDIRRLEQLKEIDDV